MERNPIRQGGENYLEWVKERIHRTTSYSSPKAFGGTIYPQLGKKAGSSLIFEEIVEKSTTKELMVKVKLEIDELVDEHQSSESNLLIHEIDPHVLVIFNLSYQYSYGGEYESIGHVWLLFNDQPSEQQIEAFELQCELISSHVFREKAFSAIEALSHPILDKDIDLSSSESMADQVAIDGVVQILEAMTAQDCIVWKANPKEQKLVNFVDANGLETRHTIEIPFGKGIAGLCYSQGKTYNVEELQNQEYLIQSFGLGRTYNDNMVRNEGWMSALFTPLSDGNTTIGVASIYSPREYGFTSLEISLFKTFCQRMTVAMIHATQSETYEKIKSKILRDAPIYNVGLEGMKTAHDAINKLGSAQDSLNELIISNRDKILPGSTLYKGISSAGDHISLSVSLLKRMTKAAVQNRENMKSEFRNVHNFITSLLSSYQSDYENRKINFHCSGDRSLHFRIDQILFSAALANVIENALYFLNISHKPKPTLRITFMATVQGIKIDIHDNGIGISPSALNDIYSLFYSEKGDRGLGLGLAIAKDYIELHGGSISATSEWGRWTNFSILTPFDNRSYKDKK